MLGLCACSLDREPLGADHYAVSSVSARCVAVPARMDENGACRIGGAGLSP